jgi:protein-disulfide isomerase
MSQRNSQQSKASARERLRIERERQAKKEKTRRQLTVAGGVVVVLAIAAGIAVAVNNHSSGGGSSSSSTDSAAWTKAAKEPLVKPANSSGPNGSRIVIGNASAKHTLEVYEDMRCPICAQFEQTSGQQVQQGAKDGTYKIQYTMGDFLDSGASPGNGSKNALAALGAALNVSKDAFVQYHTLLYSKDVHPDETKDTFADNSFLLKQAQKVPALKNNTTFETAVKKGTYRKWALDMADQFNKDGITATPTVKVDGGHAKSFENAAGMTPQQFKATVQGIIGG